MELVPWIFFWEKGSTLPASFNTKWIKQHRWDNGVSVVKTKKKKKRKTKDLLWRTSRPHKGVGDQTRYSIAPQPYPPVNSSFHKWTSLLTRLTAQRGSVVTPSKIALFLIAQITDYAADKKDNSLTRNEDLFVVIRLSQTLLTSSPTFRVQIASLHISNTNCE